MFMNKKGQADFIGNILSIIPKPLLMIFFILLLSVIVILLSPVFNSFGVQCLSDGTVVRVHESNFFTNIGLIGSLPDADEIAGDSLSAYGSAYRCTRFIDGKERLVNYGCSDCVIMNQTDYDRAYCEGDATRTSSEDLTWYFRKINCPRSASFCTIPDGYYFESDTGKFECIGSCEDESMAQKRDSKLYELGAVPYYSSSIGERTVKNTFQFACTDSLRVEPTVKGIPIFRIEYWAIIILISLLLWAIMHFRRR